MESPPVATAAPVYESDIRYRGIERLLEKFDREAAAEAATS